jgi:hypothetical protein
VKAWLKFIQYNEENAINELASLTSKNARSIKAPDYHQVCNINLITQRNYPLSGHFVKRPFNPEFRELHFLNPKPRSLNGGQQHSWITAYSSSENDCIVTPAPEVAPDAFEKVQFKFI